MDLIIFTGGRQWSWRAMAKLKSRIMWVVWFWGIVIMKKKPLYILAWLTDHTAGKEGAELSHKVCIVVSISPPSFHLWGLDIAVSSFTQLSYTTKIYYGHRHLVSYDVGACHNLFRDTSNATFKELHKRTADHIFFPTCPMKLTKGLQSAWGKPSQHHD